MDAENSQSNYELAAFLHIVYRFAPYYRKNKPVLRVTLKSEGIPKLCQNRGL